MRRLIARLMLIFSLLALILQLNYFEAKGRDFTIMNNCSYTVWPAFLSSDTTASISFSLQNQEKAVVDIQLTKNGRLWGRTGCDNSTGKFICNTGDCGSGTIDCAGKSAKGPTTLLEFTLEGYAGSDVFDTSLVNGYNVPVSMAPHGGIGFSCVATGCIFNVSGACPMILRDGSACQSPCAVFQTRQYCCTAQPGQCGPTSFSKNFKRYCPRAYSYPEDDRNSENVIFSCEGLPSYTVTFCPSSTAIVSEISKPLVQSPSTSTSPPPPPPPSQSQFPPPPPSQSQFPPSSQSPSPVPQPARSNTTGVFARQPLGSNSREKKRSWSWIFVVVVVLALSATLTLLFCGTWFFMKKKKAKERYYVDMEEISTIQSLQFDINKIKEATQNFCVDNKLGEGGFGEVYKGTLENGQEVAVKRLLQNSKQGEVEFKTEVVLVAKLQHKNLVKLLGFCATSKEKILVYEFLPNSSLDRFLFDSTNNVFLDWRTRFNIIVGIARGLMYLHEDSRLKVIHRDLKTSNILLDRSMNPKIADFGLAKLFKEDQTQGDTKRIVGTYGYMAPEYAITGHYSVKSDVYSFGVIVLEIISGQRNRFFGGLQVEEALLGRAWRLWNEKNPLDFVDTKLNRGFAQQEVIQCFHVGVLCIQEDAIQRPEMRLILDALSRPSVSLREPKPPHFLGNPNNGDQPSSSHSYSGTEMITDLYSRD